MMLAELESGERPSPALAGGMLNRALTVEWSPGRDSLRVVGEVDLATRDVWSDLLATLQGSDAPARLDLSGLSFIDVQGTGALVAAARRMAPTRQLTLSRPPLSLRRTLDLLWVSETPVIVIEEEEAG
jgi:anti-anti-sigma regulatory factor